jgi:uncharacterized protein (DUF2236 family)
VFGPLPWSVKEGYYEESKLFALLFGIPRRALPETWAEFLEYCRAMFRSNELHVGRPAAELCGFLLAAPSPAMRPVMAWYRIMTAGLLPEPIREQYGLHFGRRERATFDASLRALRLGHRVLPESVRYLPAYVEACQRIRGEPARHRLGRLIEKAAIRSLRRREL